MFAVTLKTSPAVEAGIADHVWTVQEIVARLDKQDARRGSLADLFKKPLEGMASLAAACANEA